ncbi:hypothetical protein [Microbispora amethystogenes]|nr:hypothetical protein [Microbispora amethystogenes]
MSTYEGSLAGGSRAPRRAGSIAPAGAIGHGRPVVAMQKERL